MQNKMILIGVAVAAIVIGVLIFAYTTQTASKANTPMTASVVPFTPLAHGEQSSVDARVNYRITSSAQLSELWHTLKAAGTPPVVDFSTHEVLAVFAGPESSVNIAVAKIEDTNQRMVSIALEKPAGSCAKKQVAASQYEIVAVPATALPLTHEDVVTTADCPE